MSNLSARFVTLVIGGGIALSAHASPAAVLGPHAAACQPGSDRPAMLVRIDGLQARQGKLRVQSYGGDPSRYFEKGAYLERVDIEPLPNGPIEVCMLVPSPGKYAISVKHDRDPAGGFSLKDGGGFSGNPNVSAMDALFKRKPSADKVQVAVRGVTQVPVKVRYLQGNS